MKCILPMTIKKETRRVDLQEDERSDVSEEEEFSIDEQLVRTSVRWKMLELLMDTRKIEVW